MVASHQVEILNNMDGVFIVKINYKSLLEDFFPSRSRILLYYFWTAPYTQLYIMKLDSAKHYCFIITIQ